MPVVQRWIPKAHSQSRAESPAYPNHQPQAEFAPNAFSPTAIPVVPAIDDYSPYRSPNTWNFPGLKILIVVLVALLSPAVSPWAPKCECTCRVEDHSCTPINETKPEETTVSSVAAEKTSASARRARPVFKSNPRQSPAQERPPPVSTRQFQVHPSDAGPYPAPRDPPPESGWVWTFVTSVFFWVPWLGGLITQSDRIVYLTGVAFHRLEPRARQAWEFTRGLLRRRLPAQRLIPQRPATTSPEPRSP